MPTKDSCLVAPRSVSRCCHLRRSRLKQPDGRAMKLADVLTTDTSLSAVANEKALGEHIDALCASLLREVNVAAADDDVPSPDIVHLGATGKMHLDTLALCQCIVWAQPGRWSALRRNLQADCGRRLRTDE